MTDLKKRLVSLPASDQRLILASGSNTRAKMLANAGLTFNIVAAAIDETAIKQSMQQEETSVRNVAETLAELKARRVSLQHPGAFVIGSDQMLAMQNKWFDKPKDLSQVQSHLETLSGQAHELIASVVVVQDGQRLWHHTDQARLYVRKLSSQFIKKYILDVGDDALSSVGAYQLEGKGSQIFSKIEGDYFTILGMPLLPLLDFLRIHKFLLD